MLACTRTYGKLAVGKALNNSEKFAKKFNKLNKTRHTRAEW